MLGNYYKLYTCSRVSNTFGAVGGLKRFTAVQKGEGRGGGGGGGGVGDVG